jgi:hypothetical protein
MKGMRGFNDLRAIGKLCLSIRFDRLKIEIRRFTAEA